MNVAFNGITIGEGTNYSIKELAGVYSVPIRTASDKLTAQDGGVVWAQKYDARHFSIQGTVWGSTRSEYKTNITNLVNAFSKLDEDKQMIITDGSSKYINCRVVVPPQIIEKSGEVSLADFRVELLAGDPFFYSTSDTGDTVGLAVKTGSPLGIPTGFPIGSVSGGVVYLDNTGAESYAKFTISNAVVNPVVTNKTTGEYFKLNRTLADGDQAVIEMKQDGLSVTVNGVSAYSDFSGEFFKIVGGSNKIVFTADGSSSTAQLKVEYYIAYLSL